MGQVHTDKAIKAENGKITLNPQLCEKYKLKPKHCPQSCIHIATPLLHL